MNRYSANQKYDFPADGSNSDLPDAREWRDHDEEQRKINELGIKSVRAALLQSTPVKPVETDKATVTNP